MTFNDNASVGGNSEIHPHLVMAVYGALAEAMPDRVSAHDGGTSALVAVGGVHPDTGEAFANLTNEPRVALSIADPDDQYRFLEIRGSVEEITDDPGAEFYRSLQRRYGMDYPVNDADVRVVITIRPDRYVAVRSGAVVGVEI